jgi:predicted nucleotide-binding protein
MVYDGINFDAAALRAAEREFIAIIAKANSEIKHSDLSVRKQAATWTFDTVEEFYAAATLGSFPEFRAASKDHKYYLSFMAQSYGVTSFRVTAPSRDEIETVFAALESNIDRCRIPNWEEKREKPVKIFIGHGQNPQWRDLKDHLHEKHDYLIEAYEIGSRAGHTIRDVLEYMLDESSFALLVMTGEDETKDGKLLARQNVVHEAGLFQGRLGFNRAIILLEQGTEEFSNIHGLQQIRFSKGKIIETYGEVLAVLKRETKCG